VTELLILVYCDSDWGNDPETRKSVIGYTFMLAGGAISWVARRQTVMTISTSEAEYVAGAKAAMEAMGLKNILMEALHEMKVNVNIEIDNQAARDERGSYLQQTNKTYRD
jgi:KUP system potassium uptake protein